MIIFLFFFKTQRNRKNIESTLSIHLRINGQDSISYLILKYINQIDKIFNSIKYPN